MSARTLGAAALLAFPLTIITGDLLRLRVYAANQEPTIESVAATLAAVEAHHATYEAASWLYWAAALLTVPMVLLLWRLAVDRAPRWAWAGGVLGMLAAVGQVVHVTGYFASHLAWSRIDHTVAAQAWLAFDAERFSHAIFVPYLVGLLLFPPVLAVAQWRARVIPLWAMLTVLVCSVLFAVLSGPWAVTVLWGVGLLVGFAPAARLAYRSRLLSTQNSLPSGSVSTVQVTSSSS